MVHDVGFVHHVPLAERHELFELVGKQLSADIKSKSGERNELACREMNFQHVPLYGIPNDITVDQRNDVSKAEARVNHQHAFGGR